MAIGLTVVGRIRQLYASRAPTAQEMLHEIERWIADARPVAFDEAVLSGSGGSHALSVRLHPAAEPITFTMPRPGVVVAAALTSSAGAGYHEYVCELLHRSGRELAISWTTDGDTYIDPTGYFDHEDRAALEAHMLAWLRALLGRIERLRAAGAQDVALALPAGVAFRHAAAVATPLGPRDEAWLRRATADPEAALDALPWWEPGTGAPFLLNRALSRMWTDVPWRPPIDEGEAHTMQLVLDDLAAAAALDPSLPYPTAEWAELAALLGAPAPATNGLHVPAGSEPIGYRRGIARVDLGPWSFEIPAAFSLAADEEGISGTDGLRTLRFAGVLLPRGAPTGEQFLAAYRGRIVPAGGIAKRFATGSLVSEAAIEAGQSAVTLRAHAIAGSQVAALEIALADESDTGWALDVWRSVRYGGDG